jgi:hypothetical protein
MTMPDIKVERYSLDSVYHPGPNGEHESCGWSGLIEDADATWILFFNDRGEPALFWGERDEDGGVVGDPIKLGELTPA